MESSLTIFAIPKPFTEETRDAQMNSLRSWARISGAETILFGDDEGVDRAAAVVGARHFPDIQRSELGTPLLSAVFDIARAEASSGTLCYANADIILFEEVVEAVAALPLKSFLTVGQRLNLDVYETVDFDSLSDVASLRAAARTRGQLEPPWGCDYFLFPRFIDWSLPPFAVGRPAWDNWLIQEALRRRIPVVDLTPSVLAIHQNHGYRHVPSGTGSRYEGPEADSNREHAGYIFADLDNATHVMIRGVVKRVRGWRYVRKKLLDLEARGSVASGPIRFFRSLLRRLQTVPRRGRGARFG